MNLNSILKLIFYIIICLIIGSSGAYFTAQSINTWYPSLVKPFFNPPNFIFGPVWTSIFILLGICLWGILKSKHPLTKTVLNLFILQFIFNILWSFFFFGLKSPGLALIDIVLLLSTLVFFFLHLYKIQKWLAYSQILYLAWVSFASILNAAIYLLN
jgi:benzodiazapine receptor